MIRLTIPGNPVTKKNHSRIVTNGGRPFLIPSKQYKEYEARAAWHVPKLGIDYPVNVKCVYYMQTRRKVDLGNLLAGTCDLLVACGFVADDNSNIIRSHDGSRVLYDKEHPRVEVTVTRSEEPQEGRTIGDICELWEEMRLE